MRDNPINLIDRYGFDVEKPRPENVPFGLQASDLYSSKVAGASAQLRSTVEANLLAKYGKDIAWETLKAATEKVLEAMSRGGRYLEITDISIVMRKVEVFLAEDITLIKTSTKAINLTIIAEKTTTLAKLAGKAVEALPYAAAIYDGYVEYKNSPEDERLLNATGAAVWSLGTGMLAAAAITALGVSVVPGLVLAVGAGLVANYVWNHGAREAWQDMVRYPFGKPVY